MQPSTSMSQSNQAPQHFCILEPCTEMRGKQWENVMEKMTGNGSKVVEKSLQGYKNHSRTPNSMNIKKSMHQSPTARIKRQVLTAASESMRKASGDTKWLVAASLPEKTDAAAYGVTPGVKDIALLIHSSSIDENTLWNKDKIQMVFKCT